MKYENAKDVLPKELLEELKKYAAGKLLYVPLGDKKRNWGEASGHKEKIEKRNRMICSKYANGVTISELADENFLSIDSIKKIIYSKKRDKKLEYVYDMESAIEFSNAGISEEWINLFFNITCNDISISESLLEERCTIFGLAKLPLRLIETKNISETYGHMTIPLYEDNEMNKPPLVIQFKQGKFSVIVQYEMFRVLKEQKVNAYPTFILIKEEDYKVFMKNYGRHLICDIKAFGI